jgi:hypothetical protein
VDRNYAGGLRGFPLVLEHKQPAGLISTSLLSVFNNFNTMMLLKKMPVLIAPVWCIFVGSENVARQSQTLTLTMNVADLSTIKPI